MKIIDCFMYFDEDMLLDLRLNTLDKHVSHFIICEAAFNHNGLPKKLNFNIKNFSKFKNKISYIALNQQPSNLKIIKNDDSEKVKKHKTLDNALIRENYQRNSLLRELNKFSNDDLIIISDLDEIPNLDNFTYKSKITIFQQKMFYYKFNLYYPNFLWVGSKVCKKKDLIDPQWLRNIKSRKYPIWRFDILFSKKKYNDIAFIKNGGWHFTNIKNAEEIDHKMKNFLHHYEYENSGIKIEDIKKLINNKKVLYDYKVDQRKNKWSSNISLKKIQMDQLPKYIASNTEKYNRWLD